jgi:hypothetical protein
MDSGKVQAPAQKKLSVVSFILTCIVGYVILIALLAVLGLQLLLVWIVMLFVSIPVYIKAVKSTYPTPWVFAYIFTSSFIVGPISNIASVWILHKHGLL